jgi:hypothetical protein
VPAARAEAILEMLWRIDALADVNELTRLLGA